MAAASVASATCGSTLIPSTPQRERERTKKKKLREVGEEEEEKQEEVEDIFHDKWTCDRERERSSLHTQMTQMKGKIMRLDDNVAACPSPFLLMMHKLNICLK